MHYHAVPLGTTIYPKRSLNNARQLVAKGKQEARQLRLGCLVFDLAKIVGVVAIDNGRGLGGPKVLSLRLLFQFADNCSCVCKYIIILLWHKDVKFA